MRRRPVVKLLNTLVFITVILAVLAVVSLLLTALQATPSLSLGKITTQVSGLTGVINVPVTITNKGPLTLSNILIFVSVHDRFGTQLLQGKGGPITVPSGTTSSVPITVSFDLGKIPKDTLNRLITNSEDLTVQTSLQGSIPPLASLSGSASGTLRWGAPVNNLSIGAPEIAPLNSTHIRVGVPISFTDSNAFVPISGTALIKVTDSSGRQVGQENLSISTPAESRFKSNVQLVVAFPPDLLRTLLFNDTRLSYNASVDFQSGGSTAFSIARAISIDWRAPISNLTIGSPTVQPLNSTHIKVSVPVSLSNRNDAIDIRTMVNAKIFNATSDSLVGTGGIAINAPHNTKFSGNLTAIIALPKPLSTLVFNDEILKYRVQLQGTYSSFQFGFSWSIEVNWGAPLANFAVGSPTLNSFNSSGVQVSVPVTFQNHSPWIGISTPVRITVHNSTSGDVLATGTLQVIAPPGSAFNERLPLTVRLSQSFLDSILFRDRTISMTVDFAGEYAGFAFSVQHGFSFRWGAPLSCFALGKVSVVSFNSTGLGVQTILSFTNHLPAPFFAPVSITIVNSTSGETLGSGALLINAPAGGNFSQRLNLLVRPTQEAMSTLLFDDRNVSLTLNISTHLLGVTLSGSKTITFLWKAPVESLTFGKLSVQPYNATKAQFTLPFNFTNGSPSLALSGTLSGVVLDQSGNQIGAVNSLPLSASSQSLFSGKLTGLLDVASASQHQFILKLAFQSSFGTVTRVMMISA